MTTLQIFFTSLIPRHLQQVCRCNVIHFINHTSFQSISIIPAASKEYSNNMDLAVVLVL